VGGGFAWDMVDVPFRPHPGRPGRNEHPAPTQRVDSRLPMWWLPILLKIAAKRGLKRHSAVREAVWEYMLRYADPEDLPKD